MGKYDTEKFAVRKSTAGLGLFSKTFFKKDDFIIEYTGDRMSSKKADEIGGKYLFDVSDSLVINGQDRKNLSRYINHSCKPNAYAEIDEDEGRVRIYAQKKINPEEEITYHYGKEYWDWFIKPHGCRCQSCGK